MIRAIAAATVALLASLSSHAEDDRERIRRAVAHTVAIQGENGLFRYDFDFLAGRPSGEDNIVRQAGTLFALSAYLVDTQDHSVAAPIAKGIAALAERSLPIGTGTVQSLLERAGVFSVASWRLEQALRRRGWLYATDGDGLVVRAERGGYASVQTGGTALALIAELQYRRGTGDERFAANRAGWLRGLLALHVPRGGMRDGPETLGSGPYSDGEAWLALALYHDAFPDDADAARALGELEAYVLERYGARPDRDFFHWGAISSAARLSRGDPAELASFTAAQGEFVLRAIPPEEKADAQSCALVEGLASAIAVIRSVPGRDELLARLRERVARELAHNRALQIQPGQRRMTLGGDAELRAPLLAHSAGAFLAGRYTVYERTDLTQHCISALLMAQRYGLADVRSSN